MCTTAARSASLLLQARISEEAQAEKARIIKEAEEEKMRIIEEAQAEKTRIIEEAQVSASSCHLAWGPSVAACEAALFH